jgi:CheY-like chemotaxis protein
MTAHVDKRSADDEIADLGTAKNHLQVRQTAIYVYEWPVRLWHWVNAVAILVLAVTGYAAFASDPERARRAGCDAVLSKPCSPEDLEAAIRGLIRERSRQA